jgi:hypothetical protein
MKHYYLNLSIFIKLKVITWLNKQLTGTRISDTNTLDVNPLAYNGNQQQSTGQFRPIGTLAPTSQPLITPRNDYYPQTNGNLMRNASINKQFGSNEVITSVPEPQPRPYTAMSTTNSIDYSSRSSTSTALTQAHSNNSTIPTNTALNPKYFQPLIDTSSSTKSRLTNNTNTTNDSQSNSNLDASKITSNNTSSNAIRINKQQVTNTQQQQQQQQQTNNYAALLASKSTPSLASAYFPAN